MIVREVGAQSIASQGETVVRRCVAKSFFLALAVLLAVSLAAFAQEKKQPPRVAYVWLYRMGPSQPFVDAFSGRMRELGWVETT